MLQTVGTHPNIVRLLRAVDDVVPLPHRVHVVTLLLEYMPDTLKGCVCVR